MIFLIFDRISALKMGIWTVGELLYLEMITPENIHFQKKSHVTTTDDPLKSVQNKDTLFFVTLLSFARTCPKKRI